MPTDVALTRDQTVEFIEKINIQRVAGVTLDNIKKGQSFVFIPKAGEYDKKDSDRPTVMFKGTDGAYSLLLGVAASLRVVNNLMEAVADKGNMVKIITDLLTKGKVDKTAYNKLNMDNVLVSNNLPAYGVLNMQGFGRTLDEGTNILNFSYECIGHSFVRNMSRPTELIYQPFCYEKAEEFYATRSEIDWDDRDTAIRTLNKARNTLQKNPLIDSMATFANLNRIPLFAPSLST